MQFREEKDSLGIVKVPHGAYFGAQTQRAINNFPISGIYSDFLLVRSIVQIKKGAAKTNFDLKLLQKNVYQAINLACNEILNGKHKDQFPVDIFQAGAGTSLNMNVNEVIANLANEKLGAPIGSYKYVHPNDHVNLAQSTNDIIPAALRIAILTSLPDLIKAIKNSTLIFKKKSIEFKNIIKSGRTHLQDAMPVSIGAEFRAYSSALIKDLTRIKKSAVNLNYLGIGGTAVGTGVNSHPKYKQKIIKELKIITGFNLNSALDLQESMQNTSDFLDISSSLRILAQNLIRIGNDLRLLSSGPGSGFAEIIFPEVQPGSSIMPGKINPSVIEMLTMVCFQVIGLDLSILQSSLSGQLEINVFVPLIAINLLNQIKYLTNALNIFNTKCLSGIRVNEEMVRFWLYRSKGTAAVLNPYIGYQNAEEILKESVLTNQSIKDTAIKKGVLSSELAEKIFNPKVLIKPNLMDKINEKKLKP